MRSPLMTKSVKKHWFYKCYEWTPAPPLIPPTPLTQKCALAAVRSGCSCLRFEKSAVAAVRRAFCPTQNRARGTKIGHGPKKSVARCGCSEKRSSTKSVLWLHREASFVQKKIGPGAKFPGTGPKNRWHAVAAPRSGLSFLGFEKYALAASRSGFCVLPSTKCGPQLLGQIFRQMAGPPCGQPEALF